MSLPNFTKLGKRQEEGDSHVSARHSHGLKRKSPQTEDSESFSDEFEEESMTFKEENHRRKSSKRRRPSKVHNFSERRQSEKINERMRALRELIPNCNKVDEASILDDAIEYIKAIKLQTHLISMGAGMFMPPLMFPSTIQAMHIPHVPQFLPMGIGIPPLVPSATTSRQVAENIGSRAIPKDRLSNTTSRDSD